MNNCNDLFLLVIVAIGIYFVMNNPEKGSKVSVKSQAGGGDIDKMILKGVKQGLGIPVLLALFASCGFVIWTWSKDGVWWPWEDGRGSSGTPVPGGIGVVSEITKEKGKVFIPSRISYNAFGTSDDKSMMVGLKLTSGSAPTDMQFEALPEGEPSKYILVNDVFKTGKLNVGDTHLLVYSVDSGSVISVAAGQGSAHHPGTTAVGSGAFMKKEINGGIAVAKQVTPAKTDTKIAATPGLPASSIDYDQRVVTNIYISVDSTDRTTNRHKAKLLVQTPTNPATSTVDTAILYTNIQADQKDVQLIIEYDKPLSKALNGVGFTAVASSPGALGVSGATTGSYLKGTGSVTNWPSDHFTSIKLLKLN